VRQRLENCHTTNNAVRKVFQEWLSIAAASCGTELVSELPPCRFLGSPEKYPGISPESKATHEVLEHTIYRPAI
jgi:hypothetical protein